MDGTLHDYLGLTPDEAWKLVKKLMDEIIQVNGSMTTLWHNDALADQDTWKGWQQVYLKAHARAAKKHHQARKASDA